MTTAIYARVSTDTQVPDRQIDDCRDYLDQPDETVDVYADVGESGAIADRPEFETLKDDIVNGDIDRVVSAELSRIARSTATFADFVELCLEHECSVEVVDRSFPPLKGDNPMNKTIAQLMSVIAEMERNLTIERVKSGMRRAKKEGKWTGRPPKGFTTDDNGYLVVNSEEYTRVCAAIELIEEDESFAAAARHTGISDSVLHRIMDDPEKRRLYTTQSAEDGRIKQALEGAGSGTETEVDNLRERIEAIENRVED